MGKGLQLADPVQAVQIISQDPWLQMRVRLADGRLMTALDIQEAYLAECERGLCGIDFPDWALEVLRHWRETLEALRRDPLSLADRLDPHCKLLIFGHELRRAGYTWADLHHALRTLELLRANFVPEVVHAVLAERPSALPAESQGAYHDALALLGAQHVGSLDRLRFAVRLQALELNYHELGGLHDQLVAVGQFRTVVVTPAAIDRATREAPPGGRAAVRADCIRAFREPGWVCDWRYLLHAETGRFVDLRSPFEKERRIVRREEFTGEDRAEIDMMERFARLVRR